MEQPLKSIENPGIAIDLSERNLPTNLPGRSSENYVSSRRSEDQKRMVPPSETIENSINSPIFYKYIIDKTGEKDDNESVLQKHISSLNGNSQKGKSIKVHICVYSIDTSCYIENIFLNNENSLTNLPFTFPYQTLSKPSGDHSNSLNPTILHESDLLSSSQEKQIIDMRFPFVKFLLNLESTGQSKSYSFPFFMFEKDDFTKNTDFKIDFETKYIQYFSNMFQNIHELFIENITELHEGNFILENESVPNFPTNPAGRSPENYGSSERSEEEEINIYTFFDMTKVKFSIENMTSDDKKYQWVTMDEIIYKRKYCDFAISDNTFNLFKKESIFRNVFSLDDRSFPIPFQLYLCKSSEDNKYSNVLTGEPLTLIDHPTFGYGYYFTSEPLPNTSDINKLQRFSVFIVKCFYVWNLSKMDLKSPTAQSVDERMIFPSQATDNLSSPPLHTGESLNSDITSPS